MFQGANQLWCKAFMIYDLLPAQYISPWNDLVNYCTVW